jgi:hypothetical protein
MPFLILLEDSTESVRCHGLGEAIDTACQLIAHGRSVWRIKGSEGLTLERADIEMECARRNSEGEQSKARSPLR